MLKISDYLGEATEYDKKEFLETKRPKSWLKTVSAFANCHGGVLIFGVTDGDELVGLDNAKEDSEKISEAIKAKLDPVPQVILKIKEENNKKFILLQIFSGMETPYYYVSDGSRIAFVRIGNESVPANAADLKRLVLNGSGKTYDSLTSPYKFKDFSFTKLRSVYKNRTGRELEDNDLISFGLVETDGTLTNAGILLADEPPVRNVRLFCTRWHGLNKASGIIEAEDDKEFTGSIITLLQSAEEFIKNNTKKRWRKTNNGRIEMPEYPERAVLECIVNALIHRDYMDMGSEVHIDIFDDRMEIYSPGGMYDGSMVQNLDMDRIPSKRRNPVIADIFNRLNYMERRGSGFRKIKEDYANAVNFRKEIEPQFYSDNQSFFVKLYNLNYNVSLEKVAIDEQKVAIDDGKVAIDEQKIIYEAIANMSVHNRTKEKIAFLYQKLYAAEYFGRNDISTLLNISATGAGLLLNKMKEVRVIEPVKGFGKGKYKFISQLKLNNETVQAIKNIEEGNTLSHKFHDTKELMQDLEKNNSNEIEMYKEIVKREAVPQRVYSENEVLDRFGIDKLNPDNGEEEFE